MTLRIRLLCALTFLLSFVGVAAAAEVVDPVDTNADMIGVARAVYDAFAGGHYAYAASLGVILGLALVKHYLGPKVPWLHSDVGGASMALAGSTATALAAGLASGGPITLPLVETALGVGVGAAGGYAVLKKLVVEPLLQPLRDKLPKWAQPALNLVLWIFDKPEDVPSDPPANPPGPSVQIEPVPPGPVAK